MAGYMKTKDAAAKWGLSREYVAKLCRDGKISGTKLEAGSNHWLIPTDADNPSVRKKKQ